jgi:hypothetical protein
VNFEVKDADTTLDDDGSNPTDDRVRAEAARMHNGRTASHLLGVPFCPTIWKVALAEFGPSIHSTASISSGSVVIERFRTH